MIYCANVDLYNIIKTANGSGRMNPTFAGYRPHAVIGEHCMGITFLDSMTFGSNKVRFKTLYEDVDYSQLKIGAMFQIKEGNNVIGFGKITDIQSDEMLEKIKKIIEEDRTMLNKI